MRADAGNAGLPRAASQATGAEPSVGGGYIDKDADEYARPGMREYQAERARGRGQ